MSDFCNLFTEDEWAGFEQTLDIEYYYDYAWVRHTYNSWLGRNH